MDKELYGIIGTVAGAFAGGFIGIAGTYLKMRHDERTERNRLYREKLEALFEEVSALLKYHDKMFVAGFKKKKLDVREMADWFLGINDERVLMLIAFYARGLNEKYLGCLATVEEFNKALTEQHGKFININEDGTADEETIEKLIEKRGKVQKAYKKMQSAIAKESEKYIDPPKHARLNRPE